MYIKRKAEDYLRQALARGKITLVLGARQVGKTTLVEQVLRGEAARFLNFDIEIDKAHFLAAASLAPTEALRTLGAPQTLVLDEAQRLPETARIVKGWHDAKVLTRLLLLGSSSLDLLDQSAESLTGRNDKLVLPPLLFAEALRSQDWGETVLQHPAARAAFAAPLRAFLLQRLALGGYPEVVLSPDPRRLLRELSSDYLWKDILQTGLVKTPDLIRRLLLLLAHQAGSEVSINELATQLQMGRPTVERYLDLLERTFVIFRLPAFSTNPRKEISKSHKVFFWDTGIRNALLNAFAADEFRPDLGAVWENWVIAEIAKSNVLRGSPYELFFWRSRTQAEVDLVVKTERGLRAFEIKWKPRRAGSAAFRSAYGVDVESIGSDNPFVADLLDP
ncbi:MAG: ATP-binding protein [Candidatus Competibacteraceae bacterium]|nr:ATP-binding protein [Candidatus Competibacteraceae bacterium]